MFLSEVEKLLLLLLGAVDLEKLLLRPLEELPLRLLVGSWARKTTSSVAPSPLAACSLETNSITQFLILSAVGTVILCSCATIFGFSVPFIKSMGSNSPEVLTSESAVFLS